MTRNAACLILCAAWLAAASHVAAAEPPIALSADSGPVVVFPDYYGYYQAVVPFSFSGSFVARHPRADCGSILRPNAATYTKACAPTPKPGRLWDASGHPVSGLELNVYVDWLKHGNATVILRSRSVFDFVPYVRQPLTFELIDPTDASIRQTLAVRLQLKSANSGEGGVVGTYSDRVFGEQTLGTRVEAPTPFRAYCNDPGVIRTPQLAKVFGLLAQGQRVIPPSQSKIDNPQFGWLDKPHNIEEEEFDKARAECADFPVEVGMAAMGKIAWMDGKLVPTSVCRPWLTADCKLASYYGPSDCKNPPREGAPNPAGGNVTFSCKNGFSLDDPTTELGWGAPPQDGRDFKPERSRCRITWDPPRVGNTQAGYRSNGKENNRYRATITLVGLEPLKRYALEQVNLNHLRGQAGTRLGASLPPTDAGGGLRLRDDSTIAGPSGDYAVRLMDGEREVAACGGFRLEESYANLPDEGKPLGERATNAETGPTPSPNGPKPGDACDPATWGSTARAPGLFCFDIRDEAGNVRTPYRVHRDPPACEPGEVAHYAPDSRLRDTKALCVAPNRWRFDNEVADGKECGEDWACSPKKGLTCISLGGVWKVHSTQPPCAQEGREARFPASCNFQVAGRRQNVAKCDPSLDPAWRFADEWERRPREGRPCDGSSCWAGDLLCLDQGKGDGRRWFDAGPGRKTQPRCEREGQKAMFPESCGYPKDAHGRSTAVCDPGKVPAWEFTVQGNDSEGGGGNGSEGGGGDGAEAGGGDDAEAGGGDGEESPPKAGDSCAPPGEQFCDAKLVCFKVERDGELLAPFRLYDFNNRPSGERGDKAIFAESCPFPERTAYSLGGTEWKFESEWQAINGGNSPPKEGDACRPQDCLSAGRRLICLGSDEPQTLWVWRGPVDLENGLQPRCTPGERALYTEACREQLGLGESRGATCVGESEWRLDTPSGT
ncbi:MAG: hypothetical protein HY553_02045 [Elusimicrobia bacterium]|nr:hypothetical protein [Elusimicrobiota bacterium]